jgi:hypothetical protein
MSDAVMYAAILGAVMPMVIAFINQARWPSWVKAIMAAGLSLLAGFLATYFKGDMFGRNWAHTALVVVSAAIVSYHTWWKPSGIAPTIEAHTSISS